MVTIFYIYALLELIGVMLAVYGFSLGIIKGWKAVKVTGGGVIEVTVTYLLLATGLYLLAFLLRFIGEMIGDVALKTISAVIMFGEGVCFFVIFWVLGKHIENLEKLA